jgi:hypothetical protein
MRHGSIGCSLLLLFTAHGFGGEPEKSQPDPAPVETHGGAQKMAQEAIEALKLNGVPGFIDVAFSGKPGSLPKQDAAVSATNFNKLYESALARQGKALGAIELVRTDVVGRSLVRFVYSEKMESGPVIWHLWFYRGETNEWRWMGFRLNEVLDTDFRPVKADEPYRDAAVLAQQAIDVLKSHGIPKLMDTVFAEQKATPAETRANAVIGFTTIRERAIVQQGKLLGDVELVRTEAIGSSTVRFVYLEKCERGAHVWKLTLYRAGREWKYRDLNVGDYGTEFVDK